MLQPQPPKNPDAVPAHQDRYAATRALLSEFDCLVSGLPCSEEESRRIDLCRRISILAHFDQADRAEGQPYINHPLRVAISVIRDFGAEKPAQIMAALLHDSVEDAPRTTLRLLQEPIMPEGDLRAQALNALANAFGGDTSRMVGALTNPPFVPTGSGKNWPPEMLARHKNLLYYLHFFGIIEENREAFVIKLADFADNALQLKSMPDGEKKDRLRAKYGPVLLQLISRFERADLLPKECAAFAESYLAKLKAARDEFRG